ncbi:Gfo/Idh/MocA family protein [Botrimarina hoheduenensis]|uniref:Putative oxidoreductase n=1 Tax=Botrimarina hoheduenensis TaxID=2528000 RepID=A0A5C5VU10_9BACT|nr:Gfo/Idh/MocA family oxidoreductase [Botrimarina hoheduenensis]TWT41405.1 putative oxidoreductase [Botrimarina hoheduenensis]
MAIPQNTPLRIGFVDDALDNFHANTYLAALRGPLADRGYVVAGATALAGEAAKQWCHAKQVEWFESVDALAAEVDVFAILAPSTPETHWRLCERVLPHGKPTFVDKTFAPDIATAEKIFALADQHGVAVQTTSALRTTNVQAEVAKLTEPLVNLSQWAGGASFAEYGIHPVELAVSCLGPEAQRVYVTGADRHPTIVIDFSGGRVATIDFNAGEWTPFDTVLTTAKGSKPVTVVDTTLFVDAARAILDFFDAALRGDGPLIDRAETFAVMRILEGVASPAARVKPLEI